MTGSKGYLRNIILILITKEFAFLASKSKILSKSHWVPSVEVERCSRLTKTCPGEEPYPLTGVEAAAAGHPGMRRQEHLYFLGSRKDHVCSLEEVDGWDRM